jgi:galactokinase
MASLKGAMSMVYQKRNARKRSIKLKKRVKICQWCGKEFFYIHTVTFRDYCSIYCRKKYIKHRNRLKTARRMNNPNYKLKVIARGRIKAKLDK